MEFEDMVSILQRINKEQSAYVPDELLKEILALVLKNPLDADRGKCQEQIMALINQRPEVD